MLEPIRDQIILDVVEQQTTTSSGIVLPDSAVEKPYMGVVLAVNEEFTMPDGTVKKAETKVGDIVYFGKSHGTEIQYRDKKYLVISEEFILCKESAND